MPDPRQKAIDAFNQGNINEAIQVFSNYINNAEKNSYQLVGQDFMNLSLCFYAKRDYLQAEKFAQYAIKKDPENLSFHKDLGLFLCLLARYEEGFVHLKKVYEKDPDQVLSLFATFYHKVASHDESVKYGILQLNKQDQAASDPKLFEQVKKQGSLKLNKVNVPKFSSNKEKNIISFSLWGNNPLYTKGAILNSQFIPVIYPYWTARFYCADNTDKEIIQALKKNNAQVILVSQSNEIYKALFWRYLVLDDPSVERYMIRDIDSLPTCQERTAIDQWIESKELFHIIRDHYSHCTVINAGLFAGIQGALSGFQEMSNLFYFYAQKERTVDQRFLQFFVWPIIKNECLTHDDYFKFGNNVAEYSKYGKNSKDDSIAKRWTGYFQL